MSLQYQRLVVKVGTNVITRDDGLLADAVMCDLVGQIADLRSRGIQVTVVTSGAMAAGRALLKRQGKDTDDVVDRQVLAATGQVPLIHRYSTLFADHELLCAQVLATKEDFRDRQHYLNMRSCFEALLKEGVIPIVNENDVVAVSELMFTDNDELAGLIASMLNVDALLLLTSVEGVYDSPDHAAATLVARIDPGTEEWHRYVGPETSQFGRGGMHTKCATAAKLSALGITTHIANGRRSHVLQSIIDGESIGTTFTAGKRASPVKRWIAESRGQEKGIVTINRCARDVLTSPERAASLLPVGVVAIAGEFEKGDVIAIRDETGDEVGLGMAQYGAATAKQWMGRKGGRPLVHYDYLVLT